MKAAEQIRAARIRAGMTQEQLADRTDLRQPNIAAYESGARVPSAKMLQRLLGAARARPSTVLSEHRDQVLKLVAANRAGNVRVFGSIARGEDNADSDIDLLVTFDEEADVFDQAGLICELEDLLGRSVDVVSERALGPHDAIARQALPL